MAKRRSTTYMTPGEQIAGVVFFVIYLLVLPFAAGPMFALAERLLGIALSQTVENIIYYYLLFAVTLVDLPRLFGQDLPVSGRRPGRRLPDLRGGAGGPVRPERAGVPADEPGVPQPHQPQRHHYLRPDRRRAPGDAAHRGAAGALRGGGVVPGLVFGNLKHKSRAVAYGVSCLLFALLHVWQFAVVSRDITYFLLMVQYLVPGLVLAWAYDRSGTLWTSIALHAAANALSACAHLL